ncbi:PREDICTED: ribonuclease S-4-like [Fragaria vesca subsp. vesca]
MKNSVFVFFLSVYVLVQLIKLSNAEPFEYMQFVLQYPLGVCYGTQKGDSKSPLPTKFTVHSIWPSNFSDTRVVCRQALISHPFNNAQMTSSLQTDLTNSWPSVITKKSDMQFWQHEYEEHGACSVDKGVPLFTQKSYSERGNQLWNQYDIHALLDQSNIKPDSSKPCKMTEIVAAIQKKIGKNTLLYEGARKITKFTY